MTDVGKPTNSAGSDQTRERIIEAAMKVFGSKGYAGATTRAIAANCGA